MAELLGSYWDLGFVLLGLAAIALVWWLTDERRHEPADFETGEFEAVEPEVESPWFGDRPMRFYGGKR